MADRDGAFDAGCSGSPFLEGRNLRSFWNIGRFKRQRRGRKPTAGSRSHGGRDPGKVGIEGQLEKDINLSIALRLKEYLEASDVDVILTREDDNGLYPEGERNKKMSDMKKRCQIIEKAAPDLVVSIHQNSYHEESVSGGQVFYYKNSQKGKTLAEILQKRFNYVLGEKNSRQAKANGNYYLLLHVKPPIAIVECGFLSNRAEAAKLQDEVYQDRMAWTVHMGIMEFLNRDFAG